MPLDKLQHAVVVAAFEKQACTRVYAQKIGATIGHDSMPSATTAATVLERAGGTLWVVLEVRTERRADELHIEGVLPLLEVTQVAFLDDGRPFEYSIARHRGDYSNFRSVSIR